MGAFNDRVYEVVRQIPYGCVSTYGDIARAIGQPRKALFDEEGNPTVQSIMLHREGVPFLDEEHVDLAACHWTPGRLDAEGRPTDVDWAAEMGDLF